MIIDLSENCFVNFLVLFTAICIYMLLYYIVNKLSSTQNYEKLCSSKNKINDIFS